MSNNNNTNTASAKAAGLSTKTIVLILGIVVIVAAAVVATIFLLKDKPQETISGTGNLIADESNLADIEEEIAEKVARGMFETYMTTTWTFPNGSAASTDAVMGNSVNNNYPFWFELMLSGTDEVLYKSNLIPVGSKINSIKLTKPLPAGEHQATIYIHMVDENNEQVESNMGFGITLIVLK